MNSKFTRTQWLICVIASIGFAFDIYELLMLPLIVRPALQELIGATPGTAQFERWVGLLFFVPALIGGVFGLLGGYLTDVLGRRRVLVGSILLYAFSAFAAGFSTSIEMLLILRCTTFIGVCVEFVAAVAWLAELFPDPKRRESVLGFTQAFSSLGGLLVTGAYYLSLQYGEFLPAIQGGHEAWRYTLISGVIPALPLILIRPFLPESPEWERKKNEGTLGRPSIAALFSPKYRRTTIVTTLMFACSYGAAFGALQHTPRIVPSMPQVQEMTKGKPVPAQKKIEQETAAHVNFYQEIGGLAGRFLLAVCAIWIVSRRALMRIFQIPGLIIIPLVYFFPARDNLELLKIGIFVAGMLTIAQFSFWGNYLPRMYPVHLRGTGESFAANIGGRVIGTSAALVTTSLTPLMPNRSTALAAGCVALAVYLIGSIACFWLPEPPPQDMEE
ncbi:MFS transporter [Rubinisphaera sp.]|uniref:MFS transporter n=1 Tax=Rubinisphaera sp. TaxID=2024857 RepID=UPI000C0FCFBC|nr:MFS transporter [Rubinisphaera sp.]MBV09408.1 MFS transporter [Rubinisphaera sp.]HCS54059.1 MFS transporter [Planctomycetaceae bacterium]